MLPVAWGLLGDDGRGVVRPMFSRFKNLFFFFVALALVGCGSSRERADLVFVNGVEPETLDPALITAQPAGRLAKALFEGLTRFDKTGIPVPGVAERWEISEEGKRYTFHLRKDAEWSNGEPVTAGDFIWAWTRALSPETGCDYAGLFYCIRGAETFNRGEGGDLEVRAEGAHTLVVDLVAPTSYFLDMCAYVTYLPLHKVSVEAAGDAWIKPGNLVGNGAYRLVSWRLNDRIRLEKNSRYWNRDGVALESIDVLPISDPNTAINFFVTGGGDLMMDKGMIPPGMGDALRKKEWFHTAPFLGTYFMRFNVTEAPFDDARVRRAFAMAIDRQRVVEKITRLGEETASSLVPPGCGRGYEPPPGLPYDVARARSLMEEAGYPGGKGFPLVTYLYPTRSIEKNIAVELQSMWKEALGVEVALHKQEWKVYLNSLKTLEYNIGRSSWVGDYNDPNTFLDMFLTGSGNNRTGFASSDYDALIRRAAQTPGVDGRNRTLRAAEAVLLEGEAVVAPIYFYVGTQFYHAERLGGVQANLLDEHPLQDMYWKVRER